MERADAEVGLAAAGVQAVRQKIREQKKDQSALEERRRDHLLDDQWARASLEQAKLSAAQAQREAAWRAQRLEQSQRDFAMIGPRRGMLQKELDEALASRQAVQKQARLAARTTPGAPNELRRRLADLRAEAAAALGDVNSRRALRAEQRRSLEQVDKRYRSRSERLENLRRDAERLLNELNRLAACEHSLREEIAGLQREIGPAEMQLRQLEEEQSQAEEKERDRQQLLLQCEAAWNASRLDTHRMEDRLENLRREIRQDFGLAEMEEADGLAYQPPLPIQALVAQLPVVHVLPNGVEDEVKERRARLRRLNNVNAEAPQEYAKATARHHFLQTQSEDLKGAIQDLERVIRELDARLERELRSIFDAVSTEFVHFFKLFLQGGAARISITDPADILNTGIEVFTRPPGKRPLSLELLSGGERSLTACALVFAILRVSPTPFCILDEVDTTLDEANVDRLRAALASLSSQIQFIVITHNRRTLEGANSLYGITMGDDGVSRVISLRLEGDKMPQDDDGAAEPEAPIAM